MNTTDRSENPAAPSVGSSDLLAEFDRLLLKHGNAAFDCGEFTFPAGCANSEEYNALCNQKTDAEVKMREMYRAALSLANVEISHARERKGEPIK